jgi:hypothetical protein
MPDAAVRSSDAWAQNRWMCKTDEQNREYSGASLPTTRRLKTDSQFEMIFEFSPLP